MSKFKTVQVLLAVKNGEPFLLQQLESLAAQENVRIKLLVGLATSKDNSRNVLDSYATRFETFTVIETNSGSANGDFLILLQEAQPGFATAFCDQDDVWHPAKLYESLKLLEDIEGIGLVVTGWQAINEENVSLKFRYLPPTNIELKHLFFENPFIGCSIIFNADLLLKLKESIRTNKNAIIHHDWWAVSIATILGKAIGLELSLMSYRLHPKNSIGKPKTFSKVWWKNRSNLNWAKDVSFQIKSLRDFAELHGAFVQQKVLDEKIKFLSGQPRTSIKLAFSPIRYRSKFLDEVLLRFFGLARIITFLTKTESE